MAPPGRSRLLLWPAIAVAAMFALGRAVGKGSTPVDDWFHEFRRTPARELLVFTDPWVLVFVLCVALAVALSRRRWRLAVVVVVAPLVGITGARHAWRPSSPNLTPVNPAATQITPLVSMAL